MREKVIANPDRNQAVLTLRAQGWDSRRIAGVFGISKRRVEQLVSEARSDADDFRDKSERLNQILEDMD